MHNKVMVICMNCGAMAPYEPPNGNHPYGTFHWHEPCPMCGAENWSACEVGRDWRTGRLINPEKI